MAEFSGLEKARILVEALPYIQKFHGKTIVIKYGGKAMIDSELQQSVVKDIALLSLVGIRVVLVHGGGPQINQYLELLGIRPAFVDGLRVTDEKTMEVVRMVLTGKINKELVVLLKKQGISAIGLSGEDAGLLEARKLNKKLGYVGSVVSVRTEIIQSLLDDGFLPVIATTALGEEGESLNVNADDAAAKIASAIEAEKIIFLTDVDGVIVDGKLASRLSSKEVRNLIRLGKIEGGMKPKLEACLESLSNFVRYAHILNGTVQHSLILELFTDSGVGTMITGSDLD
ncbi:MAG: acetylglutamate kinase [Actinobacteria bacterium]|nr:acetylglutamate kinase [Actinomycetota bacterium]